MRDLCTIFEDMVKGPSVYVPDGSEDTGLSFREVLEIVELDEEEPPYSE